MRILLYDNFDSFTHNLADYMRQLGAEVVIINNKENDKAFTILHAVDGVIISPGPETPEKAGGLNEFIKACITKEIPLLGVCLGHQSIGQYFGAKLVKAAKPFHGKISKLKYGNSTLYKGISISFMVCRYHSLILQELESPLIITAQTDKGEIMSFEHKTLPIYGIQYHPEAILTEFGLDILRNWLGVILK